MLGPGYVRFAGFLMWVPKTFWYQALASILHACDASRTRAHAARIYRKGRLPQPRCSERIRPQKCGCT